MWYFSDVNADGLIDLVNGGSVLFNHLDDKGHPAFDSDSGKTPVPLPSAALDTKGLVEDYQSSYDQQVETFPLHDTIRRWVAPWDAGSR
jgi:hypothetical protein